MNHPYYWLEPKQLLTFRKIVFGFCALALASQFVFGIQTDGPQGLLYGRLDQPDVAKQMLTIWGERGSLAAAVILGYDYTFMLCVGLLLSVGCVFVARQQRVWVQVLGWTLGWVALLGSGFDWLETTFTVRLLTQSEPMWLVGITVWCSNLKFACWGVSLAFIVIFWLVRFINSSVSFTQP